MKCPLCKKAMKFVSCFYFGGIYVHDDRGLFYCGCFKCKKRKVSGLKINKMWIDEAQEISDKDFNAITISNNC